MRPTRAAPAVELRASPDIGTAPLKVSFHAWSEAPIQTATLDARGNGRVDYRGPDPDLQTVTYDRPGVYLPTLTVNGTRRAVGLVLVYAKDQLDAVLQKKWSGMKAALRRGDVESAVGYFATEKRATYRTMFNALTIPVADFGRLLGDITFDHRAGRRLDYEMVISEGGQRSSHTIQFIVDRDGIWRLDFI